MPSEIVGEGPRFSLRHAPCAQICRYCLISESRKRSALPFSRFEQLVVEQRVLLDFPLPHHRLPPSRRELRKLCNYGQ